MNQDALFDASFINDYSWAFDGNVPIGTCVLLARLRPARPDGSDNDLPQRRLLELLAPLRARPRIQWRHAIW